MKTTKNRGAFKIAAIAAFVLAILMTISFAGCEMATLVGGPKGDGTSTTLPTKPDPDGSTTAPSTEDNQPVVLYYNPLTGLGTDEANSLLRPVAVTLGNTPYSLPQFGLSDADILIEAPIEGGVTRLTLLTTDYNTIRKIGSVRATRSYIADLCDALGAIQFYAGTSDTGASVRFPDYDTFDYVLDNLTETFYKDTTRTDPHDLMTDGMLISMAISRAGIEKNFTEEFRAPFRFTALETNVSLPTVTNNVKIGYSATQSVQFCYNTETGMYARYLAGEPQIDGNNQQQAQFRNLFVLYTSTTTYESASGSELDLNLTDGGSGLYISNGQSAEITWTYSNGSLMMLDQNGNQLEVNRGTSYIGLVPVGSRADVSLSK